MSLPAGPQEIFSSLHMCLQSVPSIQGSIYEQEGPLRVCQEAASGRLVHLSSKQETECPDFVIRPILQGPHGGTS